MGDCAENFQECTKEMVDKKINQINMVYTFSNYYIFTCFLFKINYIKRKNGFIINFFNYKRFFKIIYFTKS